MAYSARVFGRSGLVLSGLVFFASCSAEGGDDSRNRAGVSAQAGTGATGQAGVSAGAAGQAAPAASGSGGARSSGVSGSGGKSGASGTGGASAGREASAAGRAGGSGGSGGSGGKPSANPTTSSGAAGAPPATGDLFADDFEDGDFTKPSWIDADPEAEGMWSIASAEGGKVLAQTAADADDWVIAVAGDYRWADQTVEAKVKFTSEPGKAGIFARVKDVENYYFLYLDGGSNIVLRKRVDNSSDDVMKVKVETTQDKWYTLKLSVKGDKLQGSLDGMLLVSGSDANVKTGGVGVGTDDCTAQFDDVAVKN